MNTVEELQQQLRDAEERKKKLSERLEKDRTAKRTKSEQEANAKALKTAETVPGKLVRHKELGSRLQDALRNHGKVALELVSLWSTIREKTQYHREAVRVLRDKHGSGDLGISLDSCGEKHLSQGFVERVKAIVGQPSFNVATVHLKSANQSEGV